MTSFLALAERWQTRKFVYLFRQETDYIYFPCCDARWQLGERTAVPLSWRAWRRRRAWVSNRPSGWPLIIVIGSDGSDAKTVREVLADVETILWVGWQVRRSSPCFCVELVAARRTSFVRQSGIVLAFVTSTARAWPWRCVCRETTDSQLNTIPHRVLLARQCTSWEKRSWQISAHFWGPGALRLHPVLRHIVWIVSSMFHWYVDLRAVRGH